MDLCSMNTMIDVCTFYVNCLVSYFISLIFSESRRKCTIFSFDSERTMNDDFGARNLYEKSIGFIESSFDVYKPPISLSFVDLLLKNPAKVRLTVFNHRKISENRAISIARNCTQTIMEQPLKMVVGFEFATTITLFPRKDQSAVLYNLEDQTENNEAARHLRALLRSFETWENLYNLSHVEGREKFHREILQGTRSEIGQPANFSYEVIKTDFQKLCNIRLHPFDGQHRLFTLHELLCKRLRTEDEKWFNPKNSFSSFCYVAKDASVTQDFETESAFRFLSYNLTVDASHGQGPSFVDMLTECIDNISGEVGLNLAYSSESFYGLKAVKVDRKMVYPTIQYQVRRLQSIGSKLFDFMTVGQSDATCGYRIFGPTTNVANMSCDYDSEDKAYFLSAEIVSKIESSKYTWKKAMTSKNFFDRPNVIRFTNGIQNGVETDLGWRYKNNLVFVMKFIAKGLVSPQSAADMSDFLHAQDEHFDSRLLELIVYATDTISSHIQNFLSKTTSWSAYIENKKFMILVAASLQRSIINAVRLFQEVKTNVDKTMHHQRHFYNFLSNHIDNGQFDKKQNDNFWEKFGSGMVDGSEVFFWSNFSSKLVPTRRYRPRTPCEGFLFCLPEYIETILTRLFQENKGTYNFDVATIFELFQVSEATINPFTTMDDNNRSSGAFTSLIEDSNVDVFQILQLKEHVTLRGKALPLCPDTIVKYIFAAISTPDKTTKNPQFGILKKLPDITPLTNKDPTSTAPPKVKEPKQVKHNPVPKKIFQKRKANIKLSEQMELKRTKTKGKKEWSTNHKNLEKVIPTFKDATSVPLGDEDDNFIMTVWVGKTKNSGNENEISKEMINEAIAKNPVFDAIKRLEKTKLMDLFFTVYRSDDYAGENDLATVSNWKEKGSIQNCFQEYATFLLQSYLLQNENNVGFALDNIFSPGIAHYYPEHSKCDYGWRERLLMVKSDTGTKQVPLKRSAENKTLVGNFGGFNLEIPFEKFDDSVGVAKRIEGSNDAEADVITTDQVNASIGDGESLKKSVSGFNKGMK